MPTKKAKTSVAKPKSLDQLLIPGMSPGFANYAGGIPVRLLTHGLTVIVYKNWRAKPKDRIEVVLMPGLIGPEEKTPLQGLIVLAEKSCCREKRRTTASRLRFPTVACPKEA